MRTVETTLLILLLSSLLTACGFKGPLYLPEDQPVTRPDSAESAKTAEKKETNEQDSGS